MYWKIFLHSSTIWYFHVPDICKRLRVRCACSISFWLCSSGSEVVNSCTVLTFLKNKNNNCYDGVLDSTLLLVLFAINVNLLSERLFFCEDRAEQVIIIIVIIFSLVYSILCIHWSKCDSIDISSNDVLVILFWGSRRLHYSWRWILCYTIALRQCSGCDYGHSCFLLLLFVFICFTFA